MDTRERLKEALAEFAADEQQNADERNHASLLASALGQVNADTVPEVPPGN